MYNDDVRLLVDNAGMYDAWAEETEPGASHNYVSIIGCKFNDCVHNGLVPAKHLRNTGLTLNRPEPRDEEEEISVYSVGGYAHSGRRQGHRGLPQRRAQGHWHRAEHLGYTTHYGIGRPSF